MHYCKWMLGNTSSGFVEATYKRKIVINIGDRQKGRSQSKNTFNAIFTKNDIVKNALRIFNLGTYREENIYYKKDSSKHIIDILTK